eukprot:385443-Pelagomonas_calceolata.AAC.5
MFPSMSSTLPYLHILVRVPVRVVNDDCVCCSEVDAQPTRACGQQEDPRVLCVAGRAQLLMSIWGNEEENYVLHVQNAQDASKGVPVDKEQPAFLSASKVPFLAGAVI